ncbi:hypothetical protein ACQ4PT_049391 [Festuca glaucescens]
MTPFSAPGTGAAPPRPQGPPAAAGVPRPMMGSYGNNLAAAVRVAPSQTPRVQAPIARPRMPLAPHAQGAPIAGVPRPMVNPGGAPMSAPSPTPRMQAVPQPARAPGIPPNTRAVGATVPSARPHTPLSQPTQRAPAVANPAAPSLGKRPPTTTGPSPVPAAKRHAPIPRPQQGAAPTGGAPLPTNPAVGVGAPSPSRHAPAGNATPSRPSPSQLPNLSYIGVYRDPSKGWMARAMDLKRRAARSIGPFDDPHLAALAHDRAAIACAGRGVARGAPLNFEAAFYRVETAFLHRWEGDVCDAVEKGEYEKIYAKFLRAGYKAALNIEDGDDGGEQIAESVDAHADELIASCVGDAEFFWDDVEDFFLCRAAEIGEEALKGKEDGRDDGGKLLRNRSERRGHELAILAIAGTEHCHLKKMVLVDVHAAPSSPGRRRDLDEAEPPTSCVDERATHGSERGLHEGQPLLAKPPGWLWRGVLAGGRQVAGAEMVAVRVITVLDADPRIQVVVVACLAHERQMPVA